mmetsp:Transcript_117004/g.331108  ORF Transcript_117004/g.331108 Transcript_117004/m.331108 type:complete len:211 (-) Transcript_117004:33-665(-)
MPVDEAICHRVVDPYTQHKIKRHGVAFRTSRLLRRHVEICRASTEPPILQKRLRIGIRAHDQTSKYCGEDQQSQYDLSSFAAFVPEVNEGASQAYEHNRDDPEHVALLVASEQKAREDQCHEHPWDQYQLVHIEPTALSLERAAPKHRVLTRPHPSGRMLVSPAVARGVRSSVAAAVIGRTVGIGGVTAAVVLASCWRQTIRVRGPCCPI